MGIRVDTERNGSVDHKMFKLPVLDTTTASARGCDHTPANREGPA